MVLLSKPWTWKLVISFFKSDLISWLTRWNRSNKENEEKILQMGCLYKFERDPLFDEVIASQHCLAVWSHPWEERSSFRVWIPWYECVLTHEGEKKAFLWTSNQKYHVPNSLRIILYAQK